jgi:flavodoxin
MKQDWRSNKGGRKMNTNEMAVVYFSHTGENYNVGVIEEGNTAKVAKALSNMLEIPAFEIERKVPYSKDYASCIDEAKKELQKDARPELKEEIVLPKGIKVLFLGYPNWWGQAPMPVFTFLENQDLQGVKIAPFCTHEGSGIGNTPRKIESYVGKENILPGLGIQGKIAQNNPKKVESELKNWLSRINL